MKNKLQFSKVLLMLFLAISFQTSFAQANEPTNLVATAGVGKAFIAFTAPTNIGGGSITNYQYSLDNGSSWVTLSPAVTESPLLIPGLINCTAYSIKIRAVNATGGGAASSTVTVTLQSGQEGFNWTSRTSAADNFWENVTYGNGLFVAVGGTGPGNRVMTSPDGIPGRAEPRQRIMLGLPLSTAMDFLLL